jgi:transcriptional regulator with XRE-family HTH domain
MESQYLRSLRQQKRFSQQFVADSVGVHRSVVIDWENGKYLPRGDKLSSLSQLLGVPESVLLKELKNNRSLSQIQVMQSKIQAMQDQLSLSQETVLSRN